MSSFFTVQVDLEKLTDAMFAFVTDPLPSRNDRAVIQELGDINQDLVDLLECMVLDGTDDRRDVAAFAQAIFGAQGSGPMKEER